MSIPKSGILLLDKDCGISSQTAVTRVRRLLKAQTAGHSGTLDPMASGLLVIGYGRATRVLEYLDKSEKTYLVGIQLGIETDTYDITGKVLGRTGSAVLRDRFEAVLKEFVGEQMQTPPMYSAIHYQGNRLYELARAGKKVELPARKIQIFDIHLITAAEQSSTFEFEVTCSKGTYIRSLCHDIGVRLGCFAAMASLRRVAVGCYTIASAVTLSEIQEKVNATDDSFVVSMDSIFLQFPAITTNDAGERYVRNGAVVPRCLLEPCAADGRYRLYNGSAFIAIGNLNESGFSTEKNFYEL